MYPCPLLYIHFQFMPVLQLLVNFPSVHTTLDFRSYASYSNCCPCYLFPILVLPSSSFHSSFVGGRGGDSLRTRRSGDRIPVEARFSAPVQTRRGAYPASYTVGTGSLPGLKLPGRGVDHPPHLGLRLKKVYNTTSTVSLGLRGQF